jgi:hypothetical protein
MFLWMARKVDEAANFVSVQLIEQEPGIYDKCHADYARQDKIDVAWERISRETKESGSWLSSLETIKAPEFILSWKNGCTQLFFLINILFKYPVALIHHLFHIYFRLKCNLLSSHPSSTLHGSAVYSHHQVSSILLKLLHYMSKFRITYEGDVS